MYLAIASCLLALLAAASQEGMLQCHVEDVGSCNQDMLSVSLSLSLLQSGIALESKAALTPVAGDEEHGNNQSLLDYNGGSPCQYQVVSVDDGLEEGKYCWCASCATRSPPYNSTLSALLEGYMLERSTAAAMKEYLVEAEPGDAVTGGLFIGDYLPSISKIIGESHRVNGFEPYPEFMEAAHGTIFESGLVNIYTSMTGLGNASGTSTISGYGDAHAKDVAIIALDDVLPTNRRISLIHLDVEGYELAALQGAKLTLQRWHPLVVYEAEVDELDVDPVALFLAQQGYVWMRDVLASPIDGTYLRKNRFFRPQAE